MKVNGYEIGPHANLSGANLSRANLSGANLSRANLSKAYLSGATLPFRETWEVYLAEVVPALLVAGGRSLSDDWAAHWGCHSWKNCPMAYAFDVKNLMGIPVIWRPRVEEFIMFFDAGLIPVPGEM